MEILRRKVCQCAYRTTLIFWNSAESKQPAVAHNGGRTTGRLVAAQNQVGDVIGLAGGANEIVNLLHQILQGFPCVQDGKIAHNRNPSLIRKFLTRGIKGFDDPIGKENERVARVQEDFRGRKNGVGRNAECDAAGIKTYDVAVGATKDRRVVAGVYIVKRRVEGSNSPMTAVVKRRPSRLCAEA